MAGVVCVDCAVSSATQLGSIGCSERAYQNVSTKIGVISPANVVRAVVTLLI